MMSFAYWEPVVIFTLINVILVTGLYITALSGQLSLATAAIAGIGGYVAAILTTNFGWVFILAIAVAVISGALVGALIAALTVKMRDFILKLTTLAFGEAVAVVAFNIDYIGGANSFTGIPLYSSLSVVVVSTLVALYVAWRFDGSRLGFASRAVRDDPLAAAATGVSVLRVRVVTFALGAAIVSGGGAIQAHYVLVLNPQATSPSRTPTSTCSPTRSRSATWARSRPSCSRVTGPSPTPTERFRRFAARRGGRAAENRAGRRLSVHQCLAH